MIKLHSPQNREQDDLVCLWSDSEEEFCTHQISSPFSHSLEWSQFTQQSMNHLLPLQESTKSMENNFSIEKYLISYHLASISIKRKGITTSQEVLDISWSHFGMTGIVSSTIFLQCHASILWSTRLALSTTVLWLAEDVGLGLEKQPAFCPGSVICPLMPAHFAHCNGRHRNLVSKSPKPNWCQCTREHYIELIYIGVSGAEFKNTMKYTIMLISVLDTKMYAKRMISVRVLRINIRKTKILISFIVKLKIGDTEHMDIRNHQNKHQFQELKNLNVLRKRETE